MGNYGITGWSGGSRQSLTYNLKAGQFRGMGRVNVVPSRTTIINNNIIGGGYAVYDNHQCCNNNSTPGWLKWTMGIGIGSTLLGGILNLFGIGNRGGEVEGAGGREPETRSTNEPSAKEKELEKKLQEVSAKAEQQAKEIAALKEAAKQRPEAPVQQQSANTLKDGSIIRVRDEKLGSRADISGTVTNNADGSISIKDRQNTYTYQKLAQTINYKGKEYPLYECTGATDNTTGQPKPISAQQYILVNGELIQPGDLELSGSGSGTIKKAAPSAPPPTNQSSNDTTRIETTADGQSVSDVETFMTPYKHSDGKYYSKPEQNNELFNTPWSNIAASNNAQAKNASSVKTSLENCEAFKKAGGKDVKITQNSDGTFTATFKIQGGERTLSGAALDKFIEG